ncbi:hypothetical protein HBB16_10625 [Pseudonocardia sp. MCCB 268]|nr:hypothetical protein [Pseudonocardia cytotoxica]
MLVRHDGRWYLGIGPDHTDRERETVTGDWKRASLRSRSPRISSSRSRTGTARLGRHHDVVVGRRRRRLSGRLRWRSLPAGRPARAARRKAPSTRARPRVLRRDRPRSPARSSPERPGTCG